MLWFFHMLPVQQTHDVNTSASTTRRHSTEAACKVAFASGLQANEMLQPWLSVSLTVGCAYTGTADNAISNRTRIAFSLGRFPRGWRLHSGR